MTQATRRPPALWVVAALLCALLIVVFSVRYFVAAPYSIPSDSMAPTLRSGQVVLVDRTTREIARRGDVVVFDGSGYFSPSGDGDRFWVKRVIGVEGDRVRCCTDGSLTVNGIPVMEPYLPPQLARASAVDFDVEVPRGRIFVLGDNRDDSSDSRDHLGDPGGGMIPLERVQGRVTRIVWPMENFGPLTQYNEP